MNLFRNAVLACALIFALGGCAELSKIESAYTVVSTATVSPKAVYVARNGFDALEQTATNYIVSCNNNPGGPACSKSAIASLTPLVRSGRVTRNQVTAYLKAHPDAIGIEGLYDALNDSIAAIKKIGLQYNIQGLT